jgi:hypothetical protein
MTQVKEWAERVTIYIAIGACAALGMKAVAWLVPDPPREPARIEVVRRTEC